MATKFLDNTGLAYFWGKIKAWGNSVFAPITHTHTSYAVKHSYTTAANQAKAWLRIANANTYQMDTSKPLHVQFLLTAWNPDQSADYYEQWFVDCQVFGRGSGLRIFGASGVPFSQARVLYENTNADIDTNDRPAIDIYLNYALATACHVEIQEVYNSGWTFLADGVLAASTIPTGFENRAVGVYGSGVANAGYCDYTTRTRLLRSNITSNITLANNDTYRSRVLNCTNAITITIPSLDSDYAWFLIKNFNATSTANNVTVHPSTTSVKIDDSNANIVLKPGEWVILASKAANSYTLIGDGRWKSQKITRGSYERIEGTSSAHKDLNDYIDAGFYNVKTLNVDNCPTGIGIDAVLLVYPWDHNPYCTQEITESATSGDTRRWIRKLNSTVWSSWKQVAFTNTTLAGYGITDAKIANGTITLGSSTITPLTSGSTLDATKLSGTASIDTTGNAGTATKLATSRTISLTGDVSGSASFDGSVNASITATVADDSHNHVISNVDGLQTALDGKAGKATTIAGYGITDAKIANGTITLGSNSITPLTSHQALPTLSKTDSGSGNAVTAISVSNHAITVTKGSTFLTSHQSLSDLGIGNVKNYDQSKAIKSITRSGTTFTYTCLDDTTGTFTQQDSNTTYTFATGDSDGQIKVTPSGGSAQNVSVKGLKSAAYTESSAYAAASHGTHVTFPSSGTPANIGTASNGTASTVARSDHVHALPDSGVTAGTYNQVTVDAKGRVTAGNVKHSYTVAKGAAKNWYRLANANTSQTDASKTLHAQFIVTAYNTGQDTGYYERWFVDCQVFGRNAGIRIFGNTSTPFSQARVLYENTIANIDANDRPAIDLYLNYVMNNAATTVTVEEVYNSGWTFVADGQLVASTVPSGFENVASSVRNNGVERSTYADYVSYLNRQVSSITAAFTLADSYLYRSRTLNCTGTFTITIPSINSGYMWCVIKNKNATSGVITLHPSTTSVLIDNSNADITLQPGEYVCIHSAGANNYSLIADGRWKTQCIHLPTNVSNPERTVLCADGVWRDISQIAFPIQ